MAIPGLGSIIGGGLKVAGGIAGGIMSAINNRKIKKNAIIKTVYILICLVVFLLQNEALKKVE